MPFHRTSDRIAEAGVDVEQVRASHVVIKIGNLNDASILGHPVSSLARSLIGLGVGSLQVHGAPVFLESLERAMPDPSCIQIPIPWFADTVDQFIDAVDLIVDLSNDMESILLSAHLANVRAVPLVVATWGPTWVKVMAGRAPVNLRCELEKHASFDGTPLMFAGRVASGFVLQEILDVVGQCESLAETATTVCYDVADLARTRISETTCRQIALDDAVVDVIGAGGIGVHFLEAFAPILGSSSELRIFDPDHINSENLAMQITYAAEDIGKPKAVVMAEKLRARCPANVLAYVCDYQSSPDGLNAPTLRVSCPDNFQVRAFANAASLADGVPLVDGGSSPYASRVCAYYPGKTACLEHHLPGLSEKAAAERTRANCWQQREPTLPGTNMVCGGILAGEAVRAIHPDLFGGPTEGTILFDMRFANRLGIVNSQPACHHTANF